MNIGMSIQTEACQIRGKVFEQKLVRFVERFHEVYSIEIRTSHRHYLWSRRRLAKVHTTSRPDHVWPEVWTKIGKADQNRKRQEWTNEKPKLDNARRLSGFFLH